MTGLKFWTLVPSSPTQLTWEEALSLSLLVSPASQRLMSCAPYFSLRLHVPVAPRACTAPSTCASPPFHLVLRLFTSSIATQPLQRLSYLPCNRVSTTSRDVSPWLFTLPPKNHQNRMMKIVILYSTALFKVIHKPQNGRPSV
jgi:hypothetical protein